MEEQTKNKPEQINKIAMIAFLPMVIILILVLGIVSGWKLFEVTKTGSIAMWAITILNAITNIIDLVKTMKGSVKKRHGWFNMIFAIIIFIVSIYVLFFT